MSMIYAAEDNRILAELHDMATQRTLRSATSRDPPSIGAEAKNLKQEAIDRRTRPQLTTPRKRKLDAGPVQSLPRKVRRDVSNEKAEISKLDKAIEPDRHAQPHATNAPLVTPRGSRVVKYDERPGIPISSINHSNNAGNTKTILEDACAHLIKVDARLKPIIAQHHCRMFSPEGLAEECEPFKSLSSGIMAQQVSGAAASSIKRKFIGLFSEGVQGEGDQAYPTPSQVGQ